MNKNQPFSNKNRSLLKRFSYATKGLYSVWAQEASFRFQSYCSVALFIFCLLVKPSAVWCAIFAIAVILVLALEIVNTAVEAMLDKIHPSYSEQIGFIKDCLAGSVLIASGGSLLIFVLFLTTIL